MRPSPSKLLTLERPPSAIAPCCSPPVLNPAKAMLARTSRIPRQSHRSAHSCGADDAPAPNLDHSTGPTTPPSKAAATHSCSRPKTSAWIQSRLSRQPPAPAPTHTATRLTAHDPIHRGTATAQNASQQSIRSLTTPRPSAMVKVHAVPRPHTSCTLACVSSGQTGKHYSRRDLTRFRCLPPRFQLDLDSHAFGRL